MSKPCESFPVDDAIRQAFALARPHQPQRDIAVTARALAEQRQIAALRRTNTIARLNRIWLATAWAAISAIILISAFALLESFSATTQTTASAGRSSTQTAISTTRISSATVVLEWILLLGGFGIVWLIISSIMRAVSTELYEGLLA